MKVIKVQEGREETGVKGRKGGDKRRKRHG